MVAGCWGPNKIIFTNCEVLQQGRKLRAQVGNELRASDQVGGGADPELTSLCLKTAADGCHAGLWSRGCQIPFVEKSRNLAI